MHQFKIPIFPLSEKTICDELPLCLQTVIEVVKEKDPEAYLPLFIFEPLPEPRFPHLQMIVSDSPEQLLVVSYAPEITELVFEALARVEKREPNFRGAKNPHIRLKGNTPLKSVFRQMAELPLTVFSITLRGEGDDLSFFFLRTPFTINEFQKEAEFPSAPSAG